MSLSQVLNVCPRSAIAGLGLVSAIGISSGTAAARRSAGRVSTLLLSSTVSSQQLETRNMSTSPCAYKQCITLDNINPAIKLMEYAVRGPLVIRAGAIEKELEQVCRIRSPCRIDFASRDGNYSLRLRRHKWMQSFHAPPFGCFRSVPGRRETVQGSHPGQHR